MRRQIYWVLWFVLAIPSAAHAQEALDVTLSGQLLDDRANLLRVLGVSSNNRVSVDPVRFVTRAQKLLERLGYEATFGRQGTKIDIKLRPFTVIRKVYIRGNWPIAEEEFARRLRFRPGQRLPRGPQLARAFERETRRLRKFLSRQGYFDGRIGLSTRPDGVARVNVYVDVKKGRSFKVGRVRIVQRARGRRRTALQPVNTAIARSEIERLFRYNLAPSWCSELSGTRAWRKITSSVGFRPAFDTDQFKKNVTTLIKCYHRRNYPGIRIKGSYDLDRKKKASDAVTITLRIQERKRVDVLYQGNRHVSATELNKALTLYDAGAYDDYELAQSAEQIHKLYQGKGYLQAHVSFSRRQSPHHDTVTYQIREGPEYRVASIDFVGNRAVSRKALLGLIRTRTYPLWGLGEGGYITDLQLKQDAGRIAAFYRARGYAKVQVTGRVAPDRRLFDLPGALAAVVATSTGSKYKARVRFDIAEGSATKVGTIDLLGAKRFGGKKLQRSMVLQPGKPFTARRLNQDRKRVLAPYLQNGYPYATWDPFEEHDDDPSKPVNLQITVREGKKAYFGPIFVRGNFKTEDFVIRSAIDIEPGDVFDIRKLEAAERRLRQLDIFNAVRIQLVNLTEKPTHVPLLVTLEERYDDRGSIEISGGYSTDNSVFGALQYLNKNLLGLGMNLETRGEFGPQIQSGNINLNYPRFLGSAYSFDTRLFARNEVTVRLGNLTTFGGAFTVSRNLLKSLTASLRYEFRQVLSEQALNRPTGAVDEEQQVRVPTRTGSLTAALTYDGRDNPLSPTKGVRVSARAVGAFKALGGSNNFFKFNFSGQGYVPLPFGLTFAVGIRYDHGVPISETVLPRVERFFAGGDTTIRGFEEDRASAVRQITPAYPGGPPQLRVIPAGGNIRLLTNVELQFPLWKDRKLFGFIPFIKSPIFGLPLMGAAFLDNGAVFNAYDGFRFSDFRHSGGFAVRLVTLAGFLSLEYAWPFDIELGDPRDGRIHFNFGVIF